MWQTPVSYIANALPAGLGTRGRAGGCLRVPPADFAPARVWAYTWGWVGVTTFIESDDSRYGELGGGKLPIHQEGKKEGRCVEVEL
jgi:hypothetical protein